MLGIPKLNAIFYQSIAGNEPVREWLKNLPKPDRKSIGEDIAYVQFKWPIGKPARRSCTRGGLGSQNIAGQPHCTNTFCGGRQHDDIAARVHKEDTKDTSVRDYVGGTQIQGVEA